MSDHRARYKNTGLNSNELRRRREEDSNQLRKQKRQEFVCKRRTLAPELISDDEDINSEGTAEFKIDKQVLNALNQNEDENLLIEYAQKIRKLLSKEPHPPFDDVIQNGIVPRLVELLDSPNPTILFEVAWCLTNIGSGTTEQTSVVVSFGAIPKLIRLLSHPDSKVSEQSIWALGNIIGDGANFRDIVISYGFVEAMLNLIRPTTEIGFQRTNTWVLVNLCRNKDPPPRIEVIEQILPALHYLIDSPDLPIQIDASWAISYISELGQSYCQLVIDAGLLKKITPLLSHSEPKIQTAALRALGSIVTGDEQQTQAVIDAGPLPHLCRILREDKSRIAKESLWFLSNIAAGSIDQIQSIIDNNLLPPIIHYLDNGEFGQQKEAVWVVYNFCLSGTKTQIKCLVDNDVIPPLCILLSIQDTRVVKNILETLSSILSATNSDQEVVDIFERCGGMNKIEELQNHPNEEIYTHAYDLVEKYFMQ